MKGMSLLMRMNGRRGHYKRGGLEMQGVTGV